MSEFHNITLLLFWSREAGWDGKMKNSYQWLVAGGWWLDKNLVSSYSQMTHDK